MSVIEDCGGALWIRECTFEKKEYGKCVRCGRRLKSAEAQERGYGKTCWKKHLSDTQSRLF